MYTASQLRKENIAEYLLYMWQTEDLIRGLKLDIDKIKQFVISKYPQDKQKEVTEWYESLIDMMRREEVTEKGHLQMNKNIIGALADLNTRILDDPDHRFEDYRRAFYAALPIIVELRSKSGDDRGGEIETCFNALYGQFMMKLSGKPVSEQTQQAFDRVTRFIAMLSRDFDLDEQGKLFKPKEEE